jgi:hypothetical protein
MSLINDALRRASQSERNRPRRASTPMGMEPAPAARSSPLSVLLAAGGLAALLLAGWAFWQLRNARNNPGGTVVAASIAPPVSPHVIPPPVAAPKPAPVTPAAPVNPAPASVVVSATPVAAPPVAATPAVVPPVAATPVVAPPVAAPPVVAPPAAPPVVARDNPIAWPVDMTLSAIFFSKTNPRVLINGNLYGTGDEIQGVVLKKIEKNEVTVEWNGHSKVLMLGGQ